MLGALEPLHQMMERGPQTLKETSFNQVQLKDHICRCVVFWKVTGSVVFFQFLPICLFVCPSVLQFEVQFDVMSVDYKLLHQIGSCNVLLFFSVRHMVATWWKPRNGAESINDQEMSKIWHRPGICTTWFSGESPNNSHRCGENFAVNKAFTDFSHIHSLSHRLIYMHVCIESFLNPELCGFLYFSWRLWSFSMFHPNYWCVVT